MSKTEKKHTMKINLTVFFILTVVTGCHSIQTPSQSDISAGITKNSDDLNKKDENTNIISLKQNSPPAETEKKLKIIEFCKKVDSKFESLKWTSKSCNSTDWKFDALSENGEPLVYYVYQGPNFTEVNKNTTLVLGGVHPDELNPIYMAFKLIEEIDIFKDKFSQAQVIIAPLVNPDGFFLKKSTRTNINGVDLNRNLPTHDWNYALKNTLRGDKRKFPGKAASSEAETKFQIDLINSFNPNKIISIHAPLGFLDLDFDIEAKELKKSKRKQVKSLDEILLVLSKYAGNYKIKKFGTYPGSLGNYAGLERKIPTLTIELESADSRYASKYWNDFKFGLSEVIKKVFSINNIVYK